MAIPSKYFLQSEINYVIFRDSLCENKRNERTINVKKTQNLSIIYKENLVIDSVNWKPRKHVRNRFVLS